MFGALGFEGHVRFGDAVLHEGDGGIGITRMPSLYRPRRRAPRYYTSGKVKGRKFYKHGQPVIRANTPVEVIAPQSQLSFTVRFENLTEGEVGVLFTALGQGEHEFLLKFGGGKPVCYGSGLVSLNDLQVWENDRDLYASYDVERGNRIPDDYVEEASGLLLPEQLQRLAEIWEYNRSRECPERNY
jgi:hypothetical protein